MKFQKEQKTQYISQETEIYTKTNQEIRKLIPDSTVQHVDAASVKAQLLP